MISSLITAIAALIGSCIGAAASIIATWLSQQTQVQHQELEARLQAREALYGEFITEASRLAVDAADHSLEKLDNLTSLYGLLGRIRLMAGEKVLAEAEACCRRIVDLYSMPNMTVDQVRRAVEEENFDPLKEFSIACREELKELITLSYGKNARKWRLQLR